MFQPMFHPTRDFQRNPRRGAMLVLIAICLPLCLIMAAFAVDVAWMQLVRTELRTATDAASRAGAKEISLSQSEPLARQRAKDAAQRNRVAGAPLLLADADIEVGRTTQAGPGARFQFTPGGPQLNAMRVTGKRTQGSASGPVSLLFSGVLGVTQFEPELVATSAQLDRDICLVVDRSGSMMRSLDGSPVPGGTGCVSPHATLSRWGALSIAVEAFLIELENTRQDELVGLASYASNHRQCGFSYNISDLNSDLVSNYNNIRNEMGQIGRNPVKGFTSISAGIDEGIRVLTGPRVRPFAIKTMVLMTDGRHNRGPEPVLSAQVAALEDIVIHTITFSNEADFVRMIAVANATSGQHFHAPDAAALIRIFEEIAATLPVLTTE